MTRFDRILLALAGALTITGLVLIALLSHPAEENRNRAGSTLVAGPDGLAGLYEYLSRVGLEVSRTDSADLPVPQGGALVLVGASLSRSEVDSVLERVSRGLPLFLASDDPTDPFWEAAGLPVEGTGSPGRLEPGFPSAAVRGVDRVEVEGSLRVSLSGGGIARKKGGPSSAGWVALLGDDAGSVAVQKRIGAGEVVALTDPSLLSNTGLPRSHNLRFADAALRHLAGPQGILVFDEYHHGFGTERSVAGWLATAGLLPALWLALFTLGAEGLRRHSLRLGPPRPPPEPERRAARDFIAGYSDLLRASGHRGYAVRALERSLRRRLQETVGIPYATAPKEVFRRLTVPAPAAAARAYRALERAAELAREETVREGELLSLARDVRAAEAALRRPGA